MVHVEKHCFYAVFGRVRTQRVYRPEHGTTSFYYSLKCILVKIWFDVAEKLFRLYIEMRIMEYNM